MSTGYYADSGVFQGGAVPKTGFSTVPALKAIGQAQGIAVGTASLPDIMLEQVVGLNLYRAPASAATTWTRVDQKKLSPYALWTNLFDQAPLSGGALYAVTAIAIGGAESAMSDPLPYIFIANPPPIVPCGFISAGAYGPYPLLGSDVYLDPATGEGVAGPNGDLLSVNGLECLAQDLRTRFITTQGELLLHPLFGVTKDRIIGSGQADTVAQAQILRTRFIDTVLQEPRVLEVRDVTISRVKFDAWEISFTIIAIGIEDPQRLNLVFPYFA